MSDTQHTKPDAGQGETNQKNKARAEINAKYASDFAQMAKGPSPLPPAGGEQHGETREVRTERRRNATVIDTSNGHEFVDPTERGSVIPGVFCRKCLHMRRADGKNSPCPGPVRLERRDMAAAEGNEPLSVGGLAAKVASLLPPDPDPDFQHRVQQWCEKCFDVDSADYNAVRVHRFLEEAVELAQSLGGAKSDVLQLADYVFGRPVGEPAQEVGGVMVTLAALCSSRDINLQNAADNELVRVWQKIDAIRAKQAAKPKGSPLPSPLPPAGGEQQGGDKLREPVAFMVPAPLGDEHDYYVFPSEEDATSKAGGFIQDAIDEGVYESEAEQQFHPVPLYTTALPDLADRVAALEAERDRLVAIVDKLPKTKDGQGFVPGVDSIWHPEHGPMKTSGGHAWTFSSRILRDPYTGKPGDAQVPYADCYSTEAAALSSSSPAAPKK